MAVKDIVSLEFDFVSEIKIIDKKHFCSKHKKEKTLIHDRGSTYYRCLTCKKEKDSQARRDVKLILVECHGGCCRVCGYNKTPWAMEFHHRNPEEKEFSIGANVVRSLRKNFDESKKCVLLCANCHREFHAGLFDISVIGEYEITTPLELVDKNPTLFDMELLKSKTLKLDPIPIPVPIAQLDRATAF